MKRFFLVFFILTSLFFWLLSLEALQPAVDWFCLGLANISFFFIQLIDSHITLNAAILRHGDTGFALEVTEACSALSICALWCAVTLAYPLSWKYKGLGLFIGVLLIQAVNILRIISLVYFGDGLARPQFDLVHEQIWPLLLHLLVIIGFAFWLWWGLSDNSRQENACAAS